MGVCCWHQLPSMLYRRAGWSRGRSPRDRPAARQHTRELMSTTHTHPWLIPIITWYWQIWLLTVKRVRFRGTRCWCVLSNYACTLDWCHLPGDDDASIMRCCLKASFLLHTALPNETGELYRSMVYPCPNRSVYFSVGSPGWWKLVIVQAGVPSWSRWRDAPLVREF